MQVSSLVVSWNVILEQLSISFLILQHELKFDFLMKSSWNFTFLLNLYLQIHSTFKSFIKNSRINKSDSPENDICLFVRMSLSGRQILILEWNHISLHF